MSAIFYKFALLIAMVTLVLCLLSGISILTSLFRTGVVFLGTLFVIAVALWVLRWVVSRPSAQLNQVNEQNEVK